MWRYRSWCPYKCPLWRLGTSTTFQISFELVIGIDTCARQYAFKLVNNITTGKLTCNPIVWEKKIVHSNTRTLYFSSYECHMLETCLPPTVNLPFFSMILRLSPHALFPPKTYSSLLLSPLAAFLVSWQVERHLCHPHLKHNQTVILNHVQILHSSVDKRFSLRIHFIGSLQSCNCMNINPVTLDNLRHPHQKSAVCETS